MGMRYEFEGYDVFGVIFEKKRIDMI